MRHHTVRTARDLRAPVRGVLLLVVVALIAGPVAAEATCAGSDPVFEECCCGCGTSAGALSLERPPCACHVEPLPTAPPAPSRDVTVLPLDPPVLPSWSESVARPVSPEPIRKPSGSGSRAAFADATTRLRCCVMLL